MNGTMLTTMSGMNLTIYRLERLSLRQQRQRRYPQRFGCQRCGTLLTSKRSALLPTYQDFNSPCF